MIQNIKEITGNHSEEEIYAMLKDCSMDPNETAQKLLLHDTFPEVKRKRDRRKEILNKEPAESRWKPGMQGRGNWGGRGNYSSRPTSHDAVGGKNNSVLGKENVTNHSEGGGTTPATSQDKKHAEATFVSSSSTAVADGEPVLPSESIIEPTGQRAEVAVVVVVPPIEAKKTLVSSPSGVYFSASDPVLLPSQESRVQNVVGTIRREVGSHRTPPQRKSTTAVSTSNKSQGGGKNQLSDSFQPAASTHTSLSVNYTRRSQQVLGPQKELQKGMLQEITGNYSDEEIYAMLKECSMDPNETAQKLLLQDTFHEVKRKRDRKKEMQCQICEKIGHMALNCPCLYLPCSYPNCPGIMMHLTSEEAETMGRRFLKCQYETCGNWTWFEGPVSASSSSGCFECAETGHWAKDCP